MKRFGAGLLLVAGVGLVVACRQVAGIDDRANQAPGCGGFAVASAECGGCLGSRCCDLSTACAADVSCASAFACLAACGGTPDDVSACRRACRASYPSGFGDRLAALLACQGSACAFECGLSCGGYVHPDAACEACGSACCAEATACAGSEECLAMSFCAHACSSSASSNYCASDCKKAHLAGAASASSFSECLTKKCAKSCGDPDWWCIDHPPQVPSNVAPFSFYFHVIEQADFSPVLDATVKVCRGNDVSCGAPDFVGQAPFGEAFVTIPADFSGYFEVSAPDHVTLLFFPGLYLGPGVLALAWTLPTAKELADQVGGVEPLDATRGHVWVTAHNCVGGGAKGVAITAEPAAQVAYQVDGLFLTGATGTDDTGTAVVLNAKPGTVTLTANVLSIDRPLDMRVLPVRAGALTEVVLQSGE